MNEYKEFLKHLGINPMLKENDRMIVKEVKEKISRLLTECRK